MNTDTQKKITVYCAASSHIDAKYIECGKDTGASLVQNNFTLVYGGGSQGIMGSIAHSVMQSGGHVIGITPHHIKDLEDPYMDASEIIFVDTMRERKQMLEEYGDGFLTLPGGFGTFDEIFEVITLKILGVLNKPIAILDFDDFYKPLLDYLKTLEDKGFMHYNAMEKFVVVKSIPEAMDYFKQEFVN